MAAIVHNPQESWTVRTGIDVIGSKLNDTIVNGAYPEDSLVGAYGSDQYEGHDVCIWGNEGKDVILNHGYNVVIYGGDDNDSIRNFGSNVRISGNEGSDKFIISGASENNIITDFTDGEDELWFEQGAVTAEIDTYYTKHSVVIKSAETGEKLVRLEGVTSGSSNKIVWYKDDGGTLSTNINWLLANSATTESSVKTITVTANGKLSNTLDNAIITATTGTNSIENSGNKITINGGSSNDTITNSGTDVKINGNDGDDSVSNNGGNNVTIDGGKGKDTIFSSGNDVSIFGGDGQDSIRINTSGTKVTVDGGNDNDNINNYSASSLIIGGIGNDYLYNRGDRSTINGGIGDDEIHNFGASTSIIGGSGKDEISNTGNNVTIESGDGNDSVDNLGSHVSINSGDGNDTITNRGINATNITINSSNGDDFINNIKSNVTIISGSGDDTIYNDGSNVLIDSGTGNDSIHNRAGSNITFNYRNGDGNDTIDGLKEFPTISISGGSYSSMTSGNDVIIKVGDGSITLKDAVNVNPKIIGMKDTDIDWFISYEQLTPEELKNLGETSAKSLKELIHSFEEMDIKLTLEECNNDSNNFAKAQQWTKLTVFIAKIIKQDFTKFPDGFFSTLSIFDGLLAKATEKNVDGESIWSRTKNIFDSDGVNWNEISDKSPTAFSYFSYALGLSSNIGANKLKDVTKRKDLEDTTFAVIDWGFNAFLKKLGKGAVNDAIDLLVRLGTQSNASAQNMRAALKFNTTTGKISSPFGPIHIGISALAGLVMGIDQYNISKSQYIEDQIPNSTRDALIDATATGVYEAIHRFTYGGDDAIIQIGAWIGSLLTGNEPFNIEDYGDNWVDLIARDIKYRFLNEYTGTNHDDIMASTKDGEIIYSGFGNDNITNSHSNMTIYSGADDDTVISTSETHKNYINLGSGYDSIHIYDSSSTIHGGDGKDTLFITGNDFENHVVGNNIFGDSGQDSIRLVNVDNSYVNAGTNNDYILLQNSNGNTVTGGYGKDYIELQASYNNVITYRPSNGEDVVVGYNESDTIKFTRFTENDSYDVIEDGNDIILTTGNGKIILKDALGKKLNIKISYILEQEKAINKPLEINPVINNTISRISARSSENVEVTDIGSLDNLTANGNSILTFTENSGSGIQNVDLRSSEYPQIVSLEGGNQNVQFNNENGNIAIVGESANGTKKIIFGNGNDLGIFYAPNANSNVTVGAGSDSILVDNNARVKVDMNKSNKAKIIPYSGRVILDNYNPESRAEIIIPDVTDITSAIKDNSIQLIGNEVRPNSSTRIQLNDSTNANIVNLSTEHGDTQKVGFTGINGGAVDAHELRGNFLLKGNYAENASDKQKRKPSTLISGNGHDTILADARDFVDGGNGRNQIFLTPYDLRQIRDGATIASSGNGRNTIHGFHEGFGYDGDVIQVKDFNNLKFKFDTDGLLLTANDSRIKFDGIGITSATTDDSTNSLGTNRAELIQITNGSSTMRTAVAQTNQSILVQEDDYVTPNAFFGNRSGLNFTDYSGSVEINLADGTGKLGKWDATFKGINKLQAGNGMSTLIGDDTRNTLIAGTGYTSMWGGAGNDKLIGKGNSTDKDGRTTFFFFAGDGRDVISDFTFLTPENRYDGIDDRINVGNSDINDAYRAGNNVVVVFDQNSYLILEDAVGKDFQIANMIAKVDRNIAYDGLANCYVASGGSSLTVDSTVRSAEIWLDNSHGTQFFGNIRTIDASSVEGNTSLVGNEFDDTIIAGQGDSSLWGGFSPSNDLLIGGNSRNTFFYCMGNGNDTIQGNNDKDFVILSDVSLDQIIETSITADSVSIRFNDGGSLQIQGTSDVTYQLADGSKYSANHQRLEWDSR